MKRLLYIAFIMFFLPSLCAAEQMAEKGRLFLTFDDGPINATLNILDVLQAEQVKATFFLNGIHLAGDGYEKEDLANEALIRLIEEDHVIGDHSYDHMKHNQEIGTPNTAIDSYKDVNVDIRYFSPMNSESINRALGELKGKHNNKVLTLGRFPFSNHWVLPSFKLICSCCTSDGVAPWDPSNKCGSKEQPISNSVKVAQAMAEKLYETQNMHIYGWDVHWEPESWESTAVSETLDSAEEIEEKILAVLNGTSCPLATLKKGFSCDIAPHKGKVVLLMHDFLFENSARGKGKDINLPKLAQLIRSLKSKGYQFDTLDHY